MLTGLPTIMAFRTHQRILAWGLILSLVPSPSLSSRLLNCARREELGWWECHPNAPRLQVRSPVKHEQESTNKQVRQQTDLSLSLPPSLSFSVSSIIVSKKSTLFHKLKIVLLQRIEDATSIPFYFKIQFLFHKFKRNVRVIRCPKNSCTI